jgi:hypothetical protein
MKAGYNAGITPPCLPVFAPRVCTAFLHPAFVGRWREGHRRRPTNPPPCRMPTTAGKWELEYRQRKHKAALKRQKAQVRTRAGHGGGGGGAPKKHLPPVAHGDAGQMVAALQATLVGSAEAISQLKNTVTTMTTKQRATLSQLEKQQGGLQATLRSDKLTGKLDAAVRHLHTRSRVHH